MKPSHDLRKLNERSGNQSGTLTDVESPSGRFGHPGRYPQLVASSPFHGEDLGRTLEASDDTEPLPETRMEPVVDRNLRIIGGLRPHRARSSRASWSTWGWRALRPLQLRRDHRRNSSWSTEGEVESADGEARWGRGVE